MSDKRSVHTDALETLGTIIGEKEARDAIHLAVEPVIAGESMRPGDHVKMSDGKAFVALQGEGVGIVDPFLTSYIAQGSRFWLVVYPRQITSLRHVWSHPAFADTADVPQVADDRPHSEKWMRAWAEKHMSADYYGDYDKKLSPETAYGYAIDAGHNLSVGPYEDARDHIDSEWWGHWEAITGEKGKRDEYFSCGC